MHAAPHRTVAVITALASILLLSAGVSPPPASAVTTGSLSGTVTGTDGPLERVLLRVWRLVDPATEPGEDICTSSDGKSHAPYFTRVNVTALTGPGGSYVLEGLAAGTYTVAASPERIAPDNLYFGRWHGGKAFPTLRYSPSSSGSYQEFCPDGQKTASVRAGTNTPLARIALTLGGVISGTIAPAAADSDTERTLVSFYLPPDDFAAGSTAIVDPAPPYQYTTPQVLPPGTYLAQLQGQNLSGTRADSGHGGSVTVTAGHESTYDVSAGYVTPAAQPRLIGPAVVGKKLTVSPTSWTPAATVTYYWQDVWKFPVPCGIERGVSRSSATFVVPRTLLGCRVEAHLTVPAAHRWTYEQILTSAVIIAAPSRPRSVTVTTRRTSAKVTWAVPAAHGAPVTGYRWRVKVHGHWKQWTSTSHRWFTRARPTVATMAFQIRAVNRAGTGAAAKGTIPKR